MQTISFSEKALHTVNPVYRAKFNTVSFTGEIVSDSAQPGTPVIAANTSFSGPVHMKFSAAVTTVAFDAGYFDQSGSTVIKVFDTAGNVIQTINNTQTGIQHFEFTNASGISRVSVYTVGAETNGFSLDNVAFENKGTIVNPSGNADIDGELWGYKWGQTTLTYSFPTSAEEYLTNGYASISGFEALNATQIDAMRAIIKNFDGVCGLTFRETTAPAALLRFAEANSYDTANGDGLVFVDTARGTPPDPDFFSTTSWGDSWFSHFTYDNPLIGSFSYAAGLMHELGHSLGLKHGHSAQYGHGTLFPELPAGHNSYEYSVMTYDQYVGDNVPSDNAPDHPTTLMQDDIAALQYMYGADFGFRATNTTYTFDASGRLFVNGVAQGDAPINGHALLTLWDGGGYDTYDFSTKTVNLRVDLAPGAWTTFGALADLGDGHFARGNLANALLYRGDVSSLIERVYGGTGNDVIYGNAAANRLEGGAGGDVINGREGRDTLVGGTGKDQFLFNTAVSAANLDTILDYVVADDTIRLDSRVFTGLAKGYLAASAFVAGTKALDASDRIIYNSATGAIYFDADGSGSGAAIAFAKVTAGLSLNQLDFLVV